MVQVYQIVYQYNYIELVFFFFHKLIRFEGFLNTPLCIEILDLIVKINCRN